MLHIENGLRLCLQYTGWLLRMHEKGDAVIDHFWCPWIVMYWKTVLWIVNEVHSVKHELLESSIVYTYTNDQLRKINDKFGQKTLTSIWWLDLTSFLSLLSNMSKTSGSVSSGVPDTEKQMKARGRRPSAFIVSRVTTKEEQIILHLASPWVFALKIATSLSLIRRPKLIAIMHNKWHGHLF